mgnify:FL=1
MEKVYSLDEERYYDYDDLLEQIENENPDAEYVYVGTKISYTHADFINGKEIIELIQNRAYEESEDYSGNYISQFENKSKTEHKDMHLVIERLIADYLGKTISQPDFFKVKDIGKITVEQFKKMQ